MCRWQRVVTYTRVTIHVILRYITLFKKSVDYLSNAT